MEAAVITSGQVLESVPTPLIFDDKLTIYDFKDMVGCMQRSVQVDDTSLDRATGIANMFKVTKKLTSAIGQFETIQFEMLKSADLFALLGGLLAIAATTHRIYETQFTRNILE